MVLARPTVYGMAIVVNVTLVVSVGTAQSIGNGEISWSYRGVGDSKETARLDYCIGGMHLLIQ